MLAGELELDEYLALSSALARRMMKRRADRRKAGCWVSVDIGVSVSSGRLGCGATLKRAINSPNSFESSSSSFSSSCSIIRSIWPGRVERDSSDSILRAADSRSSANGISARGATSQHVASIVKAEALSKVACAFDARSANSGGMMQSTETYVSSKNQVGMYGLTHHKWRQPPLSPATVAEAPRQSVSADPNQPANPKPSAVQHT